MKIETDLWTYLATQNKPIVMYGMGNGADKILSRLEKRGLEVSDFFASDGFVRGHSFHGKRVLSLSEVDEKYGFSKNFIILLSFGSCLDDVLQKFKELNKNYELYAPDVPVVSDGTFDLDFYNENKSDIVKARELFCDDESKKVYDNIISYKLTGKIDYLFEIDSTEDSAFETILHCDRYKIVVDAGAYNGDSAKKLLDKCDNIEKIYALEPDRRNFKKLDNFALTENKVVALNNAAWDKCEILTFDDSGNRNSTAFNVASKKQIEVDAVTIDSVCKSNADYIKYDTEGAEFEAIMGSIDTIKASSPDLLVSLYHRNEDIFKLPLLINSIDSDYKLFLRKYKYVPAWDLNLFAVK